jgi:hypothetical protein
VYAHRNFRQGEEKKTHSSHVDNQRTKNIKTSSNTFLSSLLWIREILLEKKKRGEVGFAGAKKEREK